MRKYVVDTHVHTIASGHAYSTLSDYVEQAKKIGLEMFALTDHAPQMPGAPHVFHIANQGVIPDEVDGIEILKGVEANILDFEGTLDVHEKILKSLDIVIASLHPPCIIPGSKEENTQTLINVMKNPNVDIIGHSGNPEYEIDLEKFVKAAKKYNTIIEINNSSHVGGTRKGSWDNCLKIAKLCNEYGVYMTTSSDSHYKTMLGDFSKTIEIFNEADVDDELVLTTSKEKLKNFLKNKGKIDE